MLKKEEINNPDSTLNRIPDDEPIFILRAKDPLATIVVSYWSGQAEMRGLHHDKIDEARAWVKSATDWRYDQMAKGNIETA